MRFLFPLRQTIRSLAYFLLIAILCGCTGHLIHHWEETSRDYTYIDFSRDPSPYKFSGIVGGEHSTFVKVLGYHGDRFTVAMQQEGNATFNVYGEGVTLRRTGEITQVTTVATDDLFTVEISAMTYGDYLLTITKQ